MSAAARDREAAVFDLIWAGALVLLLLGYLLYALLKPERF
ncbi:MAG: K(+)-transporting ATPase subunit F [Candidatus Eisenbacteria bacterium]|nr:K(+)-transporting ATPase subunit F [Candidatus Eisenbacteria bacterium]